jgi:hypothetical protein
MDESMLKQSFSAKLKVMGFVPNTGIRPGVGAIQSPQDGVVMVITEIDRAPNLADTGWLTMEVAGETQVVSATLHFELLDEASQRFKIRCIDPRGFWDHQLDISRNGYLGFYRAASQVYWTLKTEQGDGQGQTVIKLCDPSGNAVRLDTWRYLVTQGREPALSFDLVDYRPLERIPATGPFGLVTYRE